MEFWISWKSTGRSEHERIVAVASLVCYAGEDFEVILVAFDAGTEQLYNRVVQSVAME